MSQYQDDIWDAAEIIEEWADNGLRYKALSVPRKSIDDGDDAQDALMVVGVDGGGVRRIDWLFDPCYSRMDCEHQNALVNILEHAPESVKEFAEEIEAI